MQHNKNIRMTNSRTEMASVAMFFMNIMSEEHGLREDGQCMPAIHTQ